MTRLYKTGGKIGLAAGAIYILYRGKDKIVSWFKGMGEGERPKQPANLSGPSNPNAQ